MIDLKKFRKDNDLPQIAVARYLDISKQFLSNIENGRCDLPAKYLEKLLNNDRGWNTRAIQLDTPSIIQTIGDHSSNNTQVAGEEINSLREKIEMLEKLLEEKERTIQILLNR